MSTILDVRYLSKHYGRIRAVEDLHFSIRSGEIFGYLGPNGSGKTTTIRLILGLLRPTRGTLSLFGSPPSKSTRRRIGYLPGDLGLYEEQTGTQLLDLCRDLSGGSAPMRDTLCEQLQLSVADRRRRIRHYSKGMKQKIGIIQALQHDPDFIVLDEPTTGLDPLIQTAFFEILRDLRGRGKTVFFSSHVLPEVHALCDRVGVLAEGRLVLNTTVSDLIGSAGRMLWIKMPPAVTHAMAHVPEIANTSFLRREDNWLVYRVPSPVHIDELLRALETMHPLDFRFEPAIEEVFLNLYKPPGEQG